MMKQKTLDSGLLACYALAIVTVLVHLLSGFAEDFAPFVGSVIGACIVASCLLTLMYAVPSAVFDNPEALLQVFVRRLPQRIQEEELGDAIEHQEGLKLEGASRGRLFCVAVNWLVCCYFNAFREAVTAVFAGRRG